LDRDARHHHETGGRRGQRSKAGGHYGCSNRERNSNTERRDGDVDLSVVPVLHRLIPAIKHLGDWGAERDGNDCRDEELASH
jgi:hypothetical protein